MVHFSNNFFLEVVVQQLFFIDLSFKNSRDLLNILAYLYSYKKAEKNKLKQNQKSQLISKQTNKKCRTYIYMPI